MRSHYCGEFNASHDGEEVEVVGWVHRRRDHGGVIFLDIRDRSGVVNPGLLPPECQILPAHGTAAFAGELQNLVRQHDPSSLLLVPPLMDAESVRLDAESATTVGLGIVSSETCLVRSRASPIMES